MEPYSVLSDGVFAPPTLRRLEGGHANGILSIEGVGKVYGSHTVLTRLDLQRRFRHRHGDSRNERRRQDDGDLASLGGSFPSTVDASSSTGKQCGQQILPPSPR